MSQRIFETHDAVRDITPYLGAERPDHVLDPLLTEEPTMSEETPLKAPTGLDSYGRVPLYGLDGQRVEIDPTAVRHEAIEVDLSVERTLTADQLSQRYDEGLNWGEHPMFSTDEWRGEVALGNTRTGYWDWVVMQIDDAVKAVDAQGATDAP